MSQWMSIYPAPKRVLITVFGRIIYAATLLPWVGWRVSRWLDQAWEQ